MKLHYIANQHVAPDSGQDIPVIDPSTGEQFDAIPAVTRPTSTTP